MRTILFLVAVGTAGIASAQPASRLQPAAVSASHGKVAADPQARAMAIRLGQIQLDDMIDKIVSQDQVVASTRSNTRFASK